MAELISPTSITCEGPIVLRAEELKKLDTVIDEQLKRLESYREKKIASLVDRELHSQSELLRQGLAQSPEELQKLRKRTEEDLLKRAYYYNLRSPKKIVSLLFESAKRITVGSFAEAILHEQVETEEPRSFLVTIACADVSAEIKVDLRGDLEIEVNPQELPEARELFNALRRWANGVKPSYWQRQQASFAGWAWALTVFIGFISWMALVDRTVIRHPAKTHGIELLQRGVSSSNLAEAVQTLLEIETEYGQTKERLGIPNGFYQWLCVAILCCFLLSIRVRTKIGVGRAEKGIDRMLSMHKLATRTVPAVIFGSFIWPSLVKFVSSILDLPN